MMMMMVKAQCSLQLILWLCSQVLFLVRDNAYVYSWIERPCHNRHMPYTYDSIHDVNLDFRPLTYNANLGVEVRAKKNGCTPEYVRLPEHRLRSFEFSRNRTYILVVLEYSVDPGLRCGAHHMVGLGYL